MYICMYVTCIFDSQPATTAVLLYRVTRMLNTITKAMYARIIESLSDNHEVLAEKGRPLDPDNMGHRLTLVHGEVVCLPTM